MRKKLENIICGAVQYDECVHNCNYPPCGMVRIAVDRLIENGVGFVTDNNDGCKWIPVTERLPEEWIYVLVLTKYDTQIIAARSGHIWREHYTHLVLEIEVTHWMPLPTPPKDGDT